MQPTCPYHDSTECAEARRLPSAGPDLGTADCGYPVRFCTRCRWSNRTYARFCRRCASPFGADALGEGVLALLRGLWAGTRRGESPVVFPFFLPAGSGGVSALASGWGFLFVGTSTGRVLVVSALRPDRVLAPAQVPGRVLALEPVGADAPAAPLAPALLATTDRGVYRLPLIPLLEAEPLWARASGEAAAAAALPLAQGALAFRVQNGRVEALWLPWTAPAVPPRAASAPFEGPMGRPLRLSDERVFFYGPDTAHVFSGANGGGGAVDPGRLDLAPYVAYPPSYDPASDEVFYVYRRGQGYGVARTAASTLASRRCTEAEYASAQVLAVGRGRVCVASDHDLEILSPVTGDRTWSLRDRLHVDNLYLAEFPPVGTAGHLLLLGRIGGRGDSLYLMPMDPEGEAQGPRRLAEVGRAALPPVAVPGGVVCVPRERADAEPRILVIHPPRGAEP